MEEGACSKKRAFVNKDLKTKLETNDENPRGEREYECALHANYSRKVAQDLCDWDYVMETFLNTTRNLTAILIFLMK